ncbi:uncharacterized protein JCM10292_006477 [Rhodotorula paludigena]|uniref:uncharacterized protein n=1 Tax=Rhodotorula paludigena TaxID=86838 RepID=UPI00317EB842
MLSVAPILDSLVCEADLPRLVFLAASASDDGQLYTGTGGYARPPAAEEPHGESVTASHVFELFSCTKLVTAIALVQLIEQGAIALEHNAAIFVPNLGRVKLFRGFHSAGELLLEENTTPSTILMLAKRIASTADDLLIRVTNLHAALTVNDAGLADNTIQDRKVEEKKEEEKEESDDDMGFGLFD